MGVIAGTRTAGALPHAGTLALTTFTPLVWGSTYAVTTEFLPPDRPLFTALTRALPAGLVLLAITRTPPRGAWIWRAAVLGVLNIGAFFPMLFLAAYRLPGGVAAVLGAVGPLFTLGFAAALLAERPTPRRLLAGLAGVLGVGLVVLRANAQLDTVGVLAGLAGAASMAAGTVLTKRWGRPDGVSALTLTGWQLTAGGLLLVPVALLIEGPPPALTGENVLGYVYLGIVGTAIAYWLWFRGLSRLPATSVAFLTLISPLSAAVIGWAALGQALTPLQLLGMAIALGGTLFGQTPARPAVGGRSPSPGSGPARQILADESCRTR
ncbi:EamA family transporter [Sphaerimonospora cavernae]|uniref:EamA family transporter n=1 Tax=Sphaerimonospora cavernae TaxID=1740611 RepID=A0ABV6U0F8_9ACTN